MACALARSSFMTVEFTVEFFTCKPVPRPSPHLWTIGPSQKGKGRFFPSKRGLAADPAPAALINVSGNAGREPARH